MKITILCVGKLKEKFYKDAVAEYAKRLLAYCNLEIIEVADDTMEREAQRLLLKMPEHAYIAALCIDGKERDSLELAHWMQSLTNHGISHIVFIIGGSTGLSKSIIDRSDEKISFSKLTFPHNLMRVILIEQIYRSFRIIKGEPYHK